MESLGFIGEQDANGTFVLKGLEKLEYRDMIQQGIASTQRTRLCCWLYKEKGPYRKTR